MITKVLDGHTLVIEHDEKILFPRSRITKGQLLNYYEKASPFLLPYCHNRPLTMQRFPRGITKESFYQKNVSDYFPPWITTKKIKNKGEGITTYVVCQNSATLSYIVNQDCVTPHLWLSTIEHINYPDRMIFDLDPYQTRIRNFKPIVEVACTLKKSLQNYGLVPFVMTTGSRGLHVTVPIKPTQTFDKVRSFARSVAEDIVALNPTKLTLEARKEKRGKRLLIDVMRNSFGATAVMPYAVRAFEKAPIATPLEWPELYESDLTSQKYTINNIFKRLTKKGDVWDKIDSYARLLPKNM